MAHTQHFPKPAGHIVLSRTVRILIGRRRGRQIRERERTRAMRSWGAR